MVVINNDPGETLVSRCAFAGMRARARVRSTRGNYIRDCYVAHRNAECV